jgi:hypothetical protein
MLLAEAVSALVGNGGEASPKMLRRGNAPAPVGR